VSNVEGSETLTPWGKMSMAYFAARGDVPIDEAHAASAWACSGCYACRERCEHKNEVATVLHDARAEYFARGVAPAAAARVVEAHEGREREAADAAAALQRPGDEVATTALLVGCSYLRHSPSVARDIIRVARRFAGEHLRVVASCCGLPLQQAGDRAGFVGAARKFANDLASCRNVVAVDPGCARAVIDEYPKIGVSLPRVSLLLDEVSAQIEELPALAREGTRYRYHDPCQLGRGLGRYAEPRGILARITGEPPSELLRNRARAECSGGGGLLPVTLPDASRAIADERLMEHGDTGETLVSACGESLRRFQSRGADVVDLFTVVADAIGKV